MIAPSNAETNPGALAPQRSGHSQLTGAEQLDLYRSAHPRRAGGDTIWANPYLVLAAGAATGLAVGWIIKRSPLFR